ncbi:MAG TPA: hypothetical protein VGG75_22870 [Trebonia sp.]|jgi:predicted flavoprotein YhiN
MMPGDAGVIVIAAGPVGLTAAMDPDARGVPVILLHGATAVSRPGIVQR